MKKACLIISILIFVLIILSVGLSVIGKRVPLVDRVAIVRIEGTIVGSQSVIDQLKEYSKDPSVKAVVLRINSPGGAVAPSQEIFEEVKKLRENKPVVVSMGALAASGGYYISAPATKIYANPGTITGSIGVIMEIPNLKGLMDKVGIKTEVIKSGKHKDLASVFRGIGEEERKILQGVLDDVHDQFIKAVAEGRKLPYDKVKSIADGRIFTGRQAKEIGLVDEIGNIEDAIREAARLGGIEGEPHIVEKEEKPSILDYLTGKVAEQYKTLLDTTISVKYLLYLK
ncbi:MAG: signal peptide peptidase SppA [Nitrospirae bacterium]|nr:signal peptide peptidase SppA [Nitrospirota bacterium]